MDTPAYIGKRMRELLEGASIGIIPYAPKGDGFGTKEERQGSMRRCLLTGYEQEDASLIWSIYSFRPLVSIWKYAFDMAAIQEYNGLFEDGREPSAEEMQRHHYAVSVACETPTRDNGLLWGFVTEDEDDIRAEEDRFAPTMQINHDLISRPDVAEFVEAVCGKPVVDMRKNRLNIWGDYRFLWHDFGYFVDPKFLCHDGLEGIKSYTAHWALKSALAKIV